MVADNVPRREDLNPALARLLTEWVHELRQRTRRRLFPTVAFLQPLDAGGAPRGSRGDDLLTHLSTGGILVPDYALRVDLLLLALGRASNPRNALVVIRSGVAESTPNDTAWLRAWRAACGIADRELGPFAVVLREGWLDVANGRSVRVPRLRNRSQAA